MSLNTSMVSGPQPPSDLTSWPTHSTTLGVYGVDTKQQHSHTTCRPTDRPTDPCSLCYDLSLSRSLITDERRLACFVNLLSTMREQWRFRMGDGGSWGTPTPSKPLHLYSPLTTMVIRPLDDRTISYCARSAFTHLGLWRKLNDCSWYHFLQPTKCVLKCTSLTLSSISNWLVEINVKGGLLGHLVWGIRGTRDLR